MKKIKKIIFFLILLLSSSCLLIAENNIFVENVNDNRLRIKITIDTVVFEEVQVNNNNFQIIQIPGLDTGTINKPRTYALPVIAKMVGIPPQGDLSLSVISSHSYTIRGKNILPNHDLKDEKGVLKPDYSKVNSSFKFKGDYPAQIATKSILGFVGNRNLASVKIFPAQYNPSQKTLQIFDELILEVKITGDTKTRDFVQALSYIDEVAPKMIINNEVSKFWRKQRETSATTAKIRDESTINSFKIYINKKGVYKLSYSYLKDTLSYWQDSLEVDYLIDFDLDTINPKNLGLFHKGEPVPIYFYGEDDYSFDEGDYFEFYADINHGEQCYYDNYSLENCFEIKHLQNENGARMAVEDGGLYETDPREYTEPFYYDYTAHFEQQEKFAYLSEYEGEREDNWFWLNKMAPSMSQLNLELKNPLPTNAREATITVDLFGQSIASGDNNGIHHAQAYINNSKIGSEIWVGQKGAQISGSMANESLDDGENSFYISLPDDQGAILDKILLNYIDVHYWREYVAHDNYLEFHKPSIYDPGLFQFKVNNFDTTGIDLYKPGISKFENLSIESSLPEGGSPYILTFQDNVPESGIKYVAVAENMKMQPKRIEPYFPNRLKSNLNQAEYLIISPRDYLQEDIVQEFVNHWQIEKNITVKPIPLEDIFNEFNGGIRSPDAIRDFLKYAYNNWQTPLIKYVMLLGDACQDEREESYQKEYSIIPAKFNWSYSVGATVDDNWYSCIVGDDELPDIILSRVPVWSKEQIRPTLEKTIHYNQNPNYNDVWRNHVMLIAGGQQFLEQNERLSDSYISNDYRITRIYPSLPSNDPYWGSTTILKDNIDDGTAFIQFMGHGGGQIWSDLNILDLPDIETLFNENYPIIASLTCYTSNFASSSPKTTCLGEKFIIEPEKGAIGFFGSAGKGFLNQDEYFQRFVLNNISSRGLRNYALANNIAKIEYTLNYGLGGISKTFLRAFNYLGDPAIEIAFPKNDLQVNMDSHEFTQGDSALIYMQNEDENIDRIAYYVADKDRLVPSPFNPDQKQQVELYNIDQKPFQDEGYLHIVDTTSGLDQYEQVVHAYAYNDTADYMGNTKFMVGNSILFGTNTIPNEPQLGDSVTIQTKICSKDGVDSARTVWWTNHDSLHYLSMSNTANFDYETINQISAYKTSKLVYYRIEWWDGLGLKHESETYNYTLLGPDLNILAFEQTFSQDSPCFKIKVRNKGDVEFPPSGNTTPYKVQIYRDNEMVLSVNLEDKIAVTESKVFHIPNSLNPDVDTLKLFVNSDSTYLETSFNNNRITKIFYMNNHLLDHNTTTTITSLDSDLSAIIDAGSISEDDYVYMNDIDSTIITEQPDIEQIELASGDCKNFDFGVYDQNCLAPDGKFYQDVELIFNYSATDSTAHMAAEEGALFIYRYDTEYSQWIRVGGLVDLENHAVSYPFVKKPGVYSLFYNKDEVAPEIAANVEGQEFTNGEYVDKEATFSLIVQDRNGIDPSSIELLLDGDILQDYSISTNNINSIPLQYQINVAEGSHTFLISALDNNGNYKEEVVNFSVQEEFKIINIGNYPNPVSSRTSDPNNEGRTRFTYTLTTAADDVTIKIFTVSGRLVNELKDLANACGYHEYPRAKKGWRCVDFDDRKLANGVYFYKVIAQKGSKKIEKIEKMAILR